MSDEKDKEIKELRESFRQFTYIVSHDLSSPLRTIGAFAKLLEEHSKDKLDDKARTYINFIMQGAEKSQNLLTGLLQYSRLNTVETNPVNIDTAKIIEECQRALSAEIEQCKAIIEIGEMPVIKADIDQIKQLFTALVSNGIKFHKEGTTPHLKISSRQNDNGWEFIFEDNGIGIEQRFHDEIFNIFRRLHRDEEYPGIGMGLAIAKKIAEIHNGSILLESEIDGGSKFKYVHQL